MQHHRFHVSGMHCTSCQILIESGLKEFPHVHSVKADLSDHCVTVAGHFGEKDAETIACELSRKVEPHGYRISTDASAHKTRWSDFSYALPIALAFIAVFIALQKLGIVNLVNSGQVTYGTAFVIGVIASVSTCMAVVGGLVLSVSANFAKEGEKVMPQVLFHAGRLVSFFLLGGLVGLLGSAFQLGGAGTFALSLLVGLVLLVLGINLLDIFPWAKRFQPTLPRFLTQHLEQIKQVNHVLTPVIVGVATFFLPCGFTQSMQIYTLSTGNFAEGAFTMFAFALGTLPVLAVLSFSSLALKNRFKSSVFFKTAGIIVIFFAGYNLINSLVVIGWIPPVFSF